MQKKHPSRQWYPTGSTINHVHLIVTSIHCLLKNHCLLLRLLSDTCNAMNKILSSFADFGNLSHKPTATKSGSCLQQCLLFVSERPSQVDSSWSSRVSLALDSILLQPSHQQSTASRAALKVSRLESTTSCQFYHLVIASSKHLQPME